MGTARRHDSLIPLSREHHYGLVVCLHIQQAIGREPTDIPSLRTRAESTVRFFQGDLAVHFETEETVLFPAMQGMPGAGSLILELAEEHREMECLIRKLRETDNGHLTATLAQFANLLELHIRKEERSLFPIYEQYITQKVSEQVAWEIEARIGLALQPRHPELLK